MHTNREACISIVEVLQEPKGKTTDCRHYYVEVAILDEEVGGKVSGIGGLASSQKPPSDDDGGHYYTSMKRMLPLPSSSSF
jgi:hypothetical protein